MNEIDLTLPEPAARSFPERRQVAVMVVDDQTLLRSGLVRLLEDDERLRVVAVSKGNPDVADVCAVRSVDVAVTDLHLSSVDGIEMIRMIATASPATRILVLAGSADTRVLAALSAGAAGFMLKDAEPDAIRSAVISVAHGDHVLCAEAALRLLEAAAGDESPTSRLTRRETEVLRLVAAGTPNRGIAEILQVSDKTVRNYVSRLYHKLALENRAQIVRYAMHAGITVPAEHR